MGFEVITNHRIRVLYLMSLVACDAHTHTPGRGQLTTTSAGRDLLSVEDIK